MLTYEVVSGGAQHAYGGTRVEQAMYVDTYVLCMYIHTYSVCMYVCIMFVFTCMY